MLHRTSIGPDVHARSIAAAAFIPETGEVLQKSFGYDAARPPPGRRPCRSGAVRLRIGACGLRPKEKARRKRRGMTGRSGVEDDSWACFPFPLLLPPSWPWFPALLPPWEPAPCLLPMPACPSFSSFSSIPFSASKSRSSRMLIEAHFSAEIPTPAS